MFQDRFLSELFDKMLKQADFLNELKYIANAIMFNTGYCNKNLEEKINKYKKLGVNKDIIDSMVLLHSFMKEMADLLQLDLNEFIKLQTTNVKEIDKKEVVSVVIKK